MKQKKAPKKNIQPQPLIAVMIPLIPCQKVTDDQAYYNGETKDIKTHELKTADMTSDHKELVKQAFSTIHTRKKIHKKNKIEVNKNVFYLGDINKQSKHNILPLLDRLALDGSELIIVAHGNPESIGSEQGYGIAPESLAELFSCYFDGESSLKQLRHISFYTCNSGYGGENSYAGRFKKAMDKKYHAINLSVTGYLGYLEEVKKGRHTYVTEKRNSGKKQRIENQAVIYKSDNTIQYPKHPFKVNFKGEGYNPDLGFEVIANAQKSNDTSSTRISESGHGFFLLVVPMFLCNHQSTQRRQAKLNLRKTSNIINDKKIRKGHRDLNDVPMLNK